MSLRFFVLCALAFLIPATAMPQSITGGAMLPACKAFLAKTDSLTFGQGACLGTVLTQMFNAHAAGGGTTLFCAPPNTSAAEGVQVTVSFLEANPQRLNEQFNWLVVSAMQKAWPCTK